MLDPKIEPADRPSARKLLGHPFITEPDRIHRARLDSPVRRFRCTTSHIVVLCEDGRLKIVDSKTREESRDLSDQANAAIDEANKGDSRHGHNTCTSKLFSLHLFLYDHSLCIKNPFLKSD